MNNRKGICPVCRGRNGRAWGWCARCRAVIQNEGWTFGYALSAQSLWARAQRAFRVALHTLRVRCHLPRRWSKWEK